MSLCDIADVDVAEVYSYLDMAIEFRASPQHSICKGSTVAAAFFEKSTRTRLSFQVAAQQIGANFLSFDPDGSSLSKGETLRDTVMTIAALGVDAFVIRHTAAGVSEKIATWTGVPVINAGEGKRSHPTQTLLDLLTIRDRFDTFDGLRVGVVGDSANSRVARGLVSSLPRLGASVVLIGPRTMIPRNADDGVELASDLDTQLAGLDVIYLLRVQKERGSAGEYPSDHEYRKRFGLTAERGASLREGAVVMHPGPMNRGVEIDSAVADGDQSLILEQVANGVPVRMAVLAEQIRRAK